MNWPKKPEGLQPNWSSAIARGRLNTSWHSCHLSETSLPELAFLSYSVGGAPPRILLPSSGAVFNLQIKRALPLFPLFFETFF